MEAEQQPKKRTKMGMTIAQKQTIIAEHEAGARVSELARRYGRPSSTISTIISQKERLKGVEGTAGVTHVTKQRSQGIDDVEKELLVWLDEQRSNGIHPDDPTIRSKARQLYKENAKAAGDANKKPFMASRGWCENFRRRSGLGKNQQRRECEDRDDGYPTLLPELRSFCCQDKKEDGPLNLCTEEVLDTSSGSADNTRDNPISSFYKSYHSVIDNVQDGENSEAEGKGEEETNHQPSCGEIDGTEENEIVSSFVFEKMCGVWEDIRSFVEKCHPDKTKASGAIKIFEEDVMSYFRDVVWIRGYECWDNNGKFIPRELQPAHEPKKSRRKGKPQKKVTDSVYSFLNEDFDSM